jgi:nucleotide-binding universal stress UspA family protein
MYHRILVAIDGSDTAHQALDAALGLARSFNATVQPLYVVSVPVMCYDVPMYNPAATRDAMLEEGALVSAQAQEQMKAPPVRGAPRVVETDDFTDVAHCIIACADEFNADLLVLGTHGRRGFQRLMLGSVAERTLRLATCPVLLVPSRDAARNPPTQLAAAL